MKTTKQLILAGAAAASLALAAPLNAQEADSSVRIGDTQVRGNIDLDRGEAKLTTGQQKPVTEANRASKLVGMNVRNLQNESLGEIHDLVIDLENGEVAYAVLSVGGFLGIGERYVAVPLKAFSVGADRNTLVLDANRERIQNAPGLAKDAWPDINSPALAADRWPGLGSAQGAAGETTTGTGTSQNRGESTVRDAGGENHPGFGTQPATRNPDTAPPQTDEDKTEPRQ